MILNCRQYKQTMHWQQFRDFFEEYIDLTVGYLFNFILHWNLLEIIIVKIFQLTNIICHKDHSNQYGCRNQKAKGRVRNYSCP